MVIIARQAEGMIALTDGLRSYHILESPTSYAVVDVIHEENKRTFKVVEKSLKGSLIELKEENRS